MMKIKSFFILIFFLLSFIFFACNDNRVKEYNHNSSINENVRSDSIIEKIRIPTH